MYETSDLRKGLKVEIEGQPYIVIDAQFVKPGKGRAFTRTKFKNMITGLNLDRTIFTGDRLTPADLEEQQMQYLYAEGDKFCFMNTESYEQVFLDAENVGDSKHYLLENHVCDVLFFQGRPIGVTTPTFVELRVVKSDPGVRGDTASGTTKPATLETGYVVRVPLFIEEGEVLRIDTRNGEYVERVKR